MAQPSTQPIALRELDVVAPLPHLQGLERYGQVQILVRVRGTPIGFATVETSSGECPPDRIAAAVVDQLGIRLLQAAAYHRLAAPLTGAELSAETLLASVRAEDADPFDRLAAVHPDAVRDADRPFISVVVCTRDRPEAMADCLAALRGLDYPAGYEVLVVDNAPTSERTAELVRDVHPWARYVREPRPGLDWARNRGIAESRGEIVAYTDDDVVVEPDWLAAIARAFAEAPEAECVTGLVLPYSQETEAERLFERYGGFIRGWERRWWAFPHHLPPDRPFHHGAGQFGTGASMAFRRRFFDRHGAFDPAMDVGTPTNGGGDLEAYFRVIQTGGVIVYDPRVVIRHQHRRDLPGLYRQISDWGTGFHAYVLCAVERFPSEAPAFRELLRWWNRSYIARRLAKGVIFPARTRFPNSLVMQEVRGSRIAAARYRLARERANSLAADAGLGPLPAVTLPGGAPPANARDNPIPRDPVAVRTVDLSRPIAAIEDVTDRARTRVYVAVDGRPVGLAEVANGGHAIPAAAVREEAARAVAANVVRRSRPAVLATLRAWLVGTPLGNTPDVDAAAHAGEAGATTEMASIVVATRDRAEDLRRCLASLVAQRASRPIEVIVVDNNPASGVTRPVVGEFAGVRLVEERRGGLSYARNAGVRAARGAIVLMTDDDVVAPEHWVEALTRPFDAAAVGAVTGNVLPRELETPAQLAFEQYGGLGRGFVPREVGPEYLAAFGRTAAPTWHLGATANAAFRRALFDDPRVGYLDEALGAGTPTGCSEDTDLFYRVLRAGWRMVYEPGAYVWHTHRRDEGSLRHQLYSYSKGHVAYHLTMLERYGDLRSAYHLGVTLPKSHARNVAAALLGRREFPLRLTLVEIAGNLAGPWALLRSRLRARRLGRGAAAGEAGDDAGLVPDDADAARGA